MLAADTAAAIDGVLLDTNRRHRDWPAGLLNGVTPTAATAGGGLAAFAGDVRALAAAIEATGPMVAPVLIMSDDLRDVAGHAMTRLIAESGPLDLPIIAAPTCPAKMLIMVDAANFASAAKATSPTS